MPVSSGKEPALGPGPPPWLYIVHRWIGIFTCLLFTVWFLSGLVMIYVPFPTLTAHERLAGLEAIDWLQVDVQPAAALSAADIPSPRAMVLEMRDGVSVWRIDPWDGAQRTVAASTRARLRAVDAAMALRVASRFGQAPVNMIEPVERDQWTVAGGFDRHRPLWKASLGDAAGTVLYVSSSTGAVVLDTARPERFWNWLGSIPHWVYPTILRQDGTAWRQVVMWVSGPCIAAAVTGIWIGLLRTRVGRRRYRGGRTSPYRGWMWWHHMAGLTGGLSLLAWIFSGWLSVDPGRLFASPGIGTPERAAYAGAAGQPRIAIEDLAPMARAAKLMKLTWNAGRPLLAIERPDRPATNLDATTLTPVRISERTILAAAARLVPGARIRQVDRLTGPDAYWYEAGALPTLPVLRVKYDDPAGTWVHIDPATGALLGDTDMRARLYRWLFDLLHKWDLNGLTSNRPAWDILLWVLSLLGLVTSVSGIWIGWIRLTRPKPSSAATAGKDGWLATCEVGIERSPAGLLPPASSEAVHDRTPVEIKKEVE